MSEMTKGTRIRVNVSSTSKGIPSWEHTVELTDEQQDPAFLIEKALAISDDLEAELQKRYAQFQDRPDMRQGSVAPKEPAATPRSWMGSNEAKGAI